MHRKNQSRKYKEALIEIIMFTLLTLAVSLLMEIVIDSYP